MYNQNTDNNRDLIAVRWVKHEDIVWEKRTSNVPQVNEFEESFYEEEYSNNLSSPKHNIEKR